MNLICGCCPKKGCKIAELLFFRGHMYSLQMHLESSLRRTPMVKANVVRLKKLRVRMARASKVSKIVEQMKRANLARARNGER